MASLLADLARQGYPLSPACIAAGLIAEAVHLRSIPLQTIRAQLGGPTAAMVRQVLAIRGRTQAVDVYDDAHAREVRAAVLRENEPQAVCLEVVSHWELSRHWAGMPAYLRQLTALEALQVYAPLGHALGMTSIASSLEDACFEALFPQSYRYTSRWLEALRQVHRAAVAHCRQEVAKATARLPGRLAVAF